MTHESSLEHTERGGAWRAAGSGVLILIVAVLARVLVTSLQDGFWSLSNELPGAVEAYRDQASWPRLYRCELMEGVRPALSSILFRVAFILGGASVASVQWLGVIMGAMIAVGGWFGARAWYGPREGLCVGLLLALLPGHIGTGLGFDPALLGPTFLVVGWALSGAVRMAVPSWLGTALLFAGSFVAGMAVLARFELALFIPFAGLALLLATSLSWMERVGAASLVCLPTLYLMGCDVYWTSLAEFPSFYKAQLNTSAGTTGMSFTQSSRAWFSYGVSPLGLFGIPLALLGSLRAGSSFSWRHLLGLSSLTTMLVFLAARSVNTTLNPQWEYAFAVLVGVTILTGLGMGQVLRRLEGLSLVGLFLLVLLVIGGAAWMERSPTGQRLIRNLYPHSAETGAVYDLFVREQLPARPPLMIGESFLTGEDMVLNVWLGRAPLEDVVPSYRLSRAASLDELLTGTLPPDIYVVVTPELTPDIPEEVMRAWQVFEVDGWLVLAAP